MSRRARVWALAIGGAALALTIALPAGAEEQKPYRVRGNIEAVQGNQLTVKTRVGETVSVTIKDDSRVLVVRPASLGAVKEGDYVGLTSINAGDKRVAIEAHIFADDLRGTAEGHVPWDLVKEPNTMTNATVGQVEEVGDQRELKVHYLQGQGDQKTKGSQTIYVPDDLPVVRMEKAPDRSVLTPGKQTFMVVRDEADGSRSVLAVVVGENGAVPPM